MTVLLRQRGRTVDIQVTDAMGRYRFSLYNLGPYTVEPSQTGSRFTPAIAEITLTNGNRGGINFQEAL